jgi:hypothetical protein
MINDPIVEEIRKIRQEHAKKYNYDLRKIAAELKKKEQLHPEKLVNFKPLHAPRKAVSE